MSSGVRSLEEGEEFPPSKELSGVGRRRKLDVILPPVLLPPLPDADSDCGPLPALRDESPSLRYSFRFQMPNVVAVVYEEE